ncbi:hypothetical protein FBU30_000237, partial [Linnemannia zychae]
CGDGVPESKKGLFNSHLADVSQFLKGYHLQINARNEADVTPAQIMKRLEEGSGSKYSIHKENYQAERIRPLQSAYKKTEIPDIAAMQRNPTKPEPAPKYNLASKPVGYSSSASSTATPAKLESRVWPPPSSNSPPTPASNISPPVSSERSWKSSVGASYTSSSPTSFNKVAPPASLTAYGGGAPEPPVNKAHQMRLEREAREKEERERIKREIEASEARQRQTASSVSSGPTTYTSTAQRLAEERKLQAKKEAEREAEQQQTASRGGAFDSRGGAFDSRSEAFDSSPSGLSSTPSRIREERLAREKEERERAQAEDSARSAREAFKAREESSLREQTTAREEELKRQKELEQRQQREAREAEERYAQEQDNLQRQRKEEEEAEAAHQRQQQEEEEERRLKQQQQRQREEEEAKQRRQREQQEADDRKRRQAEEDAERERERRLAEEEAEAEAERERQLQEEVDAAAAQSVNLGADALLASADHPELNVNGSISAIVLYSYEKSEENEMSLIEGEIIRNVTELDVGWWSGESEDGTRSGLFPANYVEVIEHAPESEQHHDAHAGHHAAAAVAHEAVHDAYGDQHGHDTNPAGGEKKPSAVALYDYQAGEPNELTFNEGEAITDIDFVTEDWWSGRSETGATGLFPANYVELIQ